MTQPVSHDRPAGFWIRFVAWFIDYAVLCAIAGVVMYPFIAPYIRESVVAMQDIAAGYQSQPPAMTMQFLIGELLGFLIVWLYFALMHSSRRQGTLGKMAIGLRVTDVRGNRISFARASGRFFAKTFISWICLVGYIMAAFTDRKQALHDLIAGTLVVYAPRDNSVNSGDPGR